MTNTNKKRKGSTKPKVKRWLDNAPEPLSTVEEVEALFDRVAQLREEMKQQSSKKASA
jgi:hypothetical protein